MGRSFDTSGSSSSPTSKEVDAIGPWEVLSSWCLNHPEDDWAVTTLSPPGGPVACARGLTIQAHHSFADCPPLDVLIHPGGRGTRAQLQDLARLDWVRSQRRQVQVMASVCTGSLVYAAPGLLSGRPATTHWATVELLASLDPTIEVRKAKRYVDDGNVVTSAGVPAGLDVALHLVDRLAGTERARQVRNAIQYDPNPPVRPGQTGPSSHLVTTMSATADRRDRGSPGGSRTPRVRNSSPRKVHVR